MAIAIIESIFSLSALHAHAGFLVFLRNEQDSTRRISGEYSYTAAYEVGGRDAQQQPITLFDFPLGHLLRETERVL